MSQASSNPDAKNVLGGPLKTCSLNPRTGFFRDGCCDTGPEDLGQHTVCAQMTREFLEFSVLHGNDLVAPMEFSRPEARRFLVRLRTSLEGSFRSRLRAESQIAVDS